MNDFYILKQKHPEIAKFLEEWKDKYEKKYDLSDETNQANFYESMLEISRHIAHTAVSAQVNTIVNNDGLETIYIKIEQKKQDN